MNLGTRFLWHYTDESNLPGIFANGLVPYPTGTEFGDGIMLFPNRQTGERLLGTLMFHLCNKGRKLMVELVVACPLTLLGTFKRRSAGLNVRMIHGGEGQAFTYHHREPLDVALGIIPPESVCMARRFDLVHMVDHYGR